MLISFDTLQLQLLLHMNKYPSSFSPSIGTISIAIILTNLIKPLGHISASGSVNHLSFFWDSKSFCVLLGKTIMSTFLEFQRGHYLLCKI